VLSNLYGLPEDIQPWRVLAHENDFLLLDDACQSGLSFDSETRVGGRTDAIGILSFGRGKALSGLGGGALVLPKRGRSVSGCSAELLEALHDSSGRASNLALLTELEESIRAIAIGILGKPQLYRLPSSLPFLHLGETHCDLEFSLRKRGRVASAAALARLQNLSRFSLEQKECAEGWLENLPALRRTLVDPVFERSQPILIRFPIFCESVSKKRQYLSRLTSAGLGASGSYPSTLRAYAPFSGISLCGPLKEARKLAERIVTLPVHRYVLPEDQARVAQILGDPK